MGGASRTRMALTAKHGQDRVAVGSNITNCNGRAVDFGCASFSVFGTCSSESDHCQRTTPWRERLPAPAVKEQVFVLVVRLRSPVTLEVSMTIYYIVYRLAEEPKSYRLELDQGKLGRHEAAMHLILLHFGDSENSLVLPAADSSPDEIMAQADLLGLSQISVAAEA